MKTRFVIWVTSDCNLSCRYCSQEYTIDQSRGYQMNMVTVRYIVNSCKSRGIHFDTIELTGGEPSLWKNLKEGVRLFREICDDITLVTNGNDPELIISLNLKNWIVSSSQATKSQLASFEPYKDRIIFNSHEHKPIPELSITDSLPADCCVRNAPNGTPQNNLLYFKGVVYYCCNAFALSGKTGTPDSITCNFNDDFMAKFSDKKFNERICSICLCNHKVWNSI